MERRAIHFALDLMRMPALARSCGSMPIPLTILETMRIAAGDQEDCLRAAVAVGVDQETLINAARFYLQHLLFSPNADCYRTLGLSPGAPKEAARLHMKILLEWLHPDRNSGLETIYSRRVIQAWKAIANGSEEVVARPPKSVSRRRGPVRPLWRVAPPWIERSQGFGVKPTGKERRTRYGIMLVLALIGISAALLYHLDTESPLVVLPEFFH